MADTVRNLLAMLEDKLVQVAVGARPALAGDGVDIASWRISGKFSSPRAALFLDGTLAANVTSPAGGAEGVELWGYALAQWWLLGVINRGETVAIVGAAQGFAQQIDVVGVFERLAIAGTVSAGVVTAKLAPIETWS